MKKSIFAVTATLLLILSTQSYAQADKGEVQNAFNNWRSAISSEDPQKIVDLYEKDAVLLATLAEKPIKSQEDRLSYFKTLTANPNLKATVNEEYVRVLDDNTALVSGIYTFSFDKDGKTTEIPARYSFVFEKINDKWMIVEHHSSQMPKL